MPSIFVSFFTLPPATITSAPIYDLRWQILSSHKSIVAESAFVKGVCTSFIKSGITMNCPFYKTDRTGKTEKKELENG